MFHRRFVGPGAAVGHLDPGGHVVHVGDLGRKEDLRGGLGFDGFGDIALMLIESNHDLRATRVLLWQLNSLEKMRMELRRGSLVMATCSRAMNSCSPAASGTSSS